MFLIVLLIRHTHGYQARALVEEEPLVPLLDTTPSNITAIAGETANLPCAVERKGEYMVIWLNTKITVISRDDSRFIDDSRISVERPKTKDWNLMIREVRYNDSGKYMCQMNTSPVQVKNVYLFVKVPPEIIEDWTDTRFRVNEGATIELVCNATGVPLPVVTWYKDGNLLKVPDLNNGGEEVTSVGELLRLNNITRYCDGIYECNAENGVPPISTRRFEVTVLFPPEVSLPTKSIGHSIGKETILQCKVSASPQESIFWTKNGSLIPLHMYKYWTELYDDGQREKTLNLNIIDIDRDDFGYYTCHASNYLGEDRETMLLYEYNVVSEPKPRQSTPPWRPSPITTVQQYLPDNAMTTPFFHRGHEQNRGQYRESVGNVFYKYNSGAVPCQNVCDVLFVVLLPLTRLFLSEGFRDL